MDLNRRHFLALASSGATAMVVPVAAHAGRALTGWLPGSQDLTVRAPEVRSLIDGSADLGGLATAGKRLHAETARVAVYPVACSPLATVRAAPGAPEICGPGVLPSSQVLAVDDGAVRLRVESDGEAREVELGAHGAHVVMAGSSRFVAWVTES